jgi:peptidoglycan biosynthesis protein MviN/MurJ (putative lipid II flippase)
MDMGPAQLANAYASGLVALCCLICAVVYHIRAPWRSTAIGRHVMTFTLAIGALTAYTVLVTMWPDGTFATIMRVGRTVLLLVIAGLVIQRTRLILKAQHDGALLHDQEPGAEDPAD